MIFSSLITFFEPIKYTKNAFNCLLVEFHLWIIVKSISIYHALSICNFIDKISNLKIYALELVLPPLLPWYIIFNKMKFETHEIFTPQFRYT